MPWNRTLSLELLATAAVLAAVGSIAAEEEKAKAAAVPAPVVVQPARVLEGHEADVYQVEFSPDGTKVATSSFDQTARLWSVADGTPLAVLSGHQSKVLALAFSRDGSLLATASEDKTVKLWEVGGEGAAKFAGHGGAVEGLVLSPDGNWMLTASADGTARLWNRAERKEALKLDGRGALHAAAFAPDGKRVAAAGAGKSVLVWDVSPITAPPAPAGSAVEIVKAGARWRYLKGTADPPAGWQKADFDDGKWEEGPSGFGYSSTPEELATVATKLEDMQGGYTKLFIRHAFTVEDPKRIEKLALRVIIDDAFIAYLNGEDVGRSENFEGDTITSVETRPVDVDLTAHVGRLAAGRNVLAIDGRNHSPESSDFVLTPSLTAALKPMEKKEEAPKFEPLALEGAGGVLFAAAFSPDGKRAAAGGEDKAVYVWELGEGADPKNPRKLDAGGAVRALAFLDPGRLASAGEGGEIKLWNLAEGKVEKALAGHQGNVLALAAGGDGARLLSGGDDKSARLWDPAAGKELKAFTGHEGAVTAVRFAGEGKTVVSASADKSLRLWNAEDGKEAKRFATPGEARAAVAAGERYYAASGAEVVELRSAKADAQKTLSGHGDMVHAVAFSPDGSQLASGSRDKTIRFWNRAEGKEIRNVAAHEGTIYTLAYNHDGSLLASGGFDRAVKLWTTADGKEAKKLEGHGEGVFILRFTKDGQFLLSGSSDRTIRKWNVAEGKEVAVFDGHPGWVCGLDFFPGESRLVSIDHGGHLLTWNLAEGKLESRKKVPTVTYDLAVSSDGKWLATANLNRQAFLIAAEEGK
jgi:WD40 repeat protein